MLVNWNGKRFLDGVLNSLNQQSYGKENFEVILVDNHSSDDSVAYTEKNFSWVKVVKNPRNDGFAGGNNVGMRASRGEYIALVNNDTFLGHEWLEELVKVAVSKKAGAVASKTVYADRPDVINNAGSELHPAKTWPIIEPGIDQKDRGQFDTVREITAFCGVSVLLNRKMLKEIGLFDEHFFMYFEDGDLSWRGQKAGWKFYLAPKSLVRHIHSGSSGTGSPLFAFHVSRNRILILFKNANLTIAFKGFLAVVRDRFFRVPKTPRNLALGVKILASALLLIPVMLLKRWGLVKEAQLDA